MNNEYFKIEQPGMGESAPPPPCIVVIFGATGDLTHRELIPALFSLSCQNFLPKQHAIIGFAKREWSDDQFRNEMYEALKDDMVCSEDEWKEFAQRMYYIPGDFRDDPQKSYTDLKNKISELQEEFDIPDNVVFHLAVPPSFYDVIIKHMSEAGLTKSEDGFTRIIIEKPFGTDEASARKLDHEIHKVLDENQIYRVDHFLGKETVQNMLVFRFANAGFEPIWNRNYIDHVKITVAEDIGIGTRGDFYEKTGVIRDMMQNHLLQLLCMTAIEPPVKFDAESLRTETYKVLKSICCTDIKRDVVIGQYGPAEIDGGKVKGYRQEDKTAEDSMTPTYVAMKLFIDNWRWAGIPIYLRTGKRMKEKLTEVNIVFEPTPHLMFPGEKKNRNPSMLHFRLQPDEGIIYRFMAKRPGAEIRLQPVNLNFLYASAFGLEKQPSAYQWLLYDAMQGDQTLFPRADWIYRAWSIIDPIVEKWKSDPWVKLPNYPAGSWGPAAANGLIQRDGRSWLEDLHH